VTSALVAPGFCHLPNRPFSDEFLVLRDQAYSWLEPYYDRDHQRRAGDWILALNPDAPEPLVIAALTHDLERSVPGGPVLDKANTPWDDPVYNRLHAERSARVVADWLAERGASASFVEGVEQPIREHEFGGSREGDLSQAADSLSFLEVNGGLAASWVIRGECTEPKAREKLRWMYERMRLPLGRELGRPLYEHTVADFERRLGRAGRALAAA
jgi:hypothetical protein